MHIALWEPEIPPNTGNIARLCAATGATLHLVGRLGFRIDDRQLKRAGLDYWHEVKLVQHADIPELIAQVGAGRIKCIETTNDRIYTQAAFHPDDCLLFGNESHGLPSTVREAFAEQTFGIPMPTGKVRSLNLATSAAIVLYEALRQLHRW